MTDDDKHLKHAPTPNTTSGQSITSSAGEFTFQFYSCARNNYGISHYNQRQEGRCTTHGQHSPPLVKLFENGMSKWTGAIFGILDVLLSMPKNSHTGQCVSETGKFIRITKTGGWQIIRKQENKQDIKVLLTFQHSTFKCSHYESLCLMVESQISICLWVCVYWFNSICVIRIWKKIDVQGSHLISHSLLHAVLNKDK